MLLEPVIFPGQADAPSGFGDYGPWLSVAVVVPRTSREDGRFVFSYFQALAFDRAPVESSEILKDDEKVAVQDLQVFRWILLLTDGEEETVPLLDMTVVLHWWHSAVPG